MPVACNATPAATRTRLLECFAAWDVAGAGTINQEELVALLAKVGVPLADIETIFTSTSLSKDGAIDYKEFVHWSIGAPPPPPVLPLLAVSVATAQQAWRDGLLEIGAAGRDGGVDASIARAAFFVDALYAYGSGEVIFKPMAGHESKEQLSLSRDVATKYFTNPLLQYVSDIRFDNAMTVVKGDLLFVQGHYGLSLVTGQSKIADYTFGYERVNGGTRIFLHHSAVVEDSPCPGEESSQAITITPQVAAAQKAWSAGILDLAVAARSGEDCLARAGEFVDAHYSYQTSQVLFKTAIGAGEARFMMDRQDAASYFGNPVLAALTGLSFENVRCVIKGELVFVMGIYQFDCSGAVHVGEYVFGYEPDGAGGVRIFLHHSSTPFL